MFWRTHATDVELVQTIDHELPERRQLTLDEHLRRCSSCAARLSELRAAESPLETACLAPPGAFADSPDPLARIRLAAALRAEAVRGQTGVRPRSDPGLTPWALLRQPVVAGLAIAVGVAAFLAVRSWNSSGALPQGEPSLPVAGLTPGAVSALSAEQLCAGERPPNVVPAAAQRQVLLSYHMETVPADRFELDALVTPELGGTAEPDNLWPQRYDLPLWNAKVKDQLERLLPALVCSGQLDLTVAQRDISTDWVAAYKKYFQTDVPLPDRTEHLAEVDDDGLVFASLAARVENPDHR